MVEPVLMTSPAITSTMLFEADKTTLPRRNLRSSSVSDSNKNGSIGESPSSLLPQPSTKELTWKMLEQEDVFLANEVSEAVGLLSIHYAPYYPRLTYYSVY